MSTSQPDQPNLHVAGVPVHFPHKPYKAQVALMHAVVKAVNNHEHALVESPTGTGKSLALLCSSLAVQEHLTNRVFSNEKEKEKDHQKQQQQRQAEEIEKKDKKHQMKSVPEEQIKQEKIQRKANQKKKEKQGLDDFFTYSNPIVDSDDDDFMPQKHKQSLPDVSWQLPSKPKQRKRPATEETPENAFMLHYNGPERPLDQPSNNALRPSQKPAVNNKTQQTHIQTQKQNHKHKEKKKLHNEVSNNNDEINKMMNEDELLNECLELDKEENDDHGEDIRKKKSNLKPIPRIFYATRTHSQVTQVIRELRKTKYKPSICILASRKEYCLNENVRKLPTRDDTCKKLILNKSCQYYLKSNDILENQQIKESVIWDIEEIKNVGKSIDACPYYASHEFYQLAKLILCPYSFLIDPIIRSARGINLLNDIVILDEAHNIENISRESASFQINVQLLNQSIDELNNLILSTKRHSKDLKYSKELLKSYKRLKIFLTCFISVIDFIIQNFQFQHHDNYQNIIFEQNHLIKLLLDSGINHSEIKHWKAAHDYIVQYGDGDEEERFQNLGMSSRPAIDINEDNDDSEDNDDGSDDDVNGYSSKNSYGYGGGGGPSYDDHEGDDYGSDESVPVRRRIKRGRISNKFQNRNGGQRGRRSNFRRKVLNNDDEDGKRERITDKENPYLAKCINLCHTMLVTLEYLFNNEEDFTLVLDRRSVNFETVTSLSLQCLNAAVCFREISSIARSIIVTSGTLSPMSSFASELGTKFSIIRSLPHVIDVKKQLYVGIVSHGPGPNNRCTFEATYHGSAKFEFQDGLGHSLIDYSKVIPGGILVFFPSYRLMEVLCTRWKSNGIWNDLLNIKKAVLCEPTQRGEEFDKILAQYYALTIKDQSENEFNNEEDNYDNLNNNVNNDEEHVYHGNLDGINGSSNHRKDGAVLLAVCRGKLSEGIDFKDETSRAVILVGIPFPYMKDITVVQKRKWNDRKRQECFKNRNIEQSQSTAAATTKHLKDKKNHLINDNELIPQSGSEWYEMQAFRALNQALGRAVRHRYDYGAILLVDIRFRQHRFLKQLPKWSQDAVRNSNCNHEKIVKDLQHFFDNIHQHLADIADHSTVQPTSKPTIQNSSNPSQQVKLVQNVQPAQSPPALAPMIPQPLAGYFAPTQEPSLPQELGHMDRPQSSDPFISASQLGPEAEAQPPFEGFIPASQLLRNHSSQSSTEFIPASQLLQRPPPP